MIFNLKEECMCSRKNEIYYGAKKNKSIKDVYLGLCVLEANEENKKIGPGRGHEEIIFALDGDITIFHKKADKEFLLEEGHVYHIPDGEKVRVSNPNGNKVSLVVAGGHTKHHHHH